MESHGRFDGLYTLRSSREEGFLSAWVSKSHFTGLDSCHGEFDINIHNAGMLCFATIDVLVVSSSHPEVSREKGTPLRKRINKVHYRCLITIWSIGIARRGFH